MVLVAWFRYKEQELRMRVFCLLLVLDFAMNLVE